MDGVKRKPVSAPSVTPARVAPRPSTPQQPQAPAPSKGWGPKAAAVPSQARNQASFSPSTPSAKATQARPAAPPPQTKEQQVQQVLAEGPRGVVGEAVEYWDKQGQQGGVSGAVGKVMSGLLEVSGLPAVERSAAELGARVGADDSKKNIALAGGKLALDSAVVIANGLTAGRATMAVAGVRGGEAAAVGVVRHYTSAATAEKIMQSGEIWASKVGNAGVNKVYLLAEGDARGMNILRRLNIGYADAKSTAKAIEFDLSKMPRDMAEKFAQAAASGPLDLEKFVTHSGNLNFEAFRSAVKVLDTEAMSLTMGQLAKAGASLGRVGAAITDLKRGVESALK